MKLIKFIAYIFYDYYSTGSRQHIKYFATLGALTLISYINLVSVLIIIKMDNIIPARTSNRIFDYIKMFFFMLPIFLVFRFLITEKELKDADYDTNKILNGRIWLVVYIVLSIIMLIILSLWKHDKL